MLGALYEPVTVNGTRFSVETGYSSLALIQQVAVNELKVDRTFVHRMLAKDSDFAIVRATVELAHALGIRAVAEGVESEELQLALVALECERGQGFFFGHPLPASSVPTLLAAVPTQRKPSRPIHLRAVESG